MLSILLILPADNSYCYRGAFRKSYSYAPLTLTMLAALVPDSSGCKIDLVDEGVEHRDYSHSFYDIVGITCVTSAAPRAYELCRFFCAKGAHVVLGGVHPTLLPNEAANHADTVIVGPAQYSWPLFINDFRSGSPKKLYKDNGNANEIQTISAPIPRRDLLRPGLYLDIPTLIARPGCLNYCDYCTIPYLGFSGKGARRVKDVVEEIIALDKKRVLFLDPNMTVDRVYAKQLFTALIPLRVQWAGLSSIDIVKDNELLSLMVESGCQGLLIGFESLQQKNLISVKKYFAEVGDYAQGISAIRNAGVMVLGCFVLGFDYDTPQSLDTLPSLVDELQIDLPRYSILTPFPGTALFKTMERDKRILTRDWSLYDTEHVVFRPNGMEPARLQEALHSAWDNSYSLSSIVKRAFRLRNNRLFGILANVGLRHYSKRLYSLKRNIHDLIDPH